MGKNVHPKKKMPKKGKKARKRKEKKRNRNNNKHALRAQAESRGDKVAVCWYDQSCDMSSWWTNRSTTRKDQTEDSTRRGQRHGAKKYRTALTMHLSSQEITSEARVPLRLLGGHLPPMPPLIKRSCSIGSRLVFPRSPLCFDQGHRMGSFLDLAKMVQFCVSCRTQSRLNVDLFGSAYKIWHTSDLDHLHPNLLL